MSFEERFARAAQAHFDEHCLAAQLYAPDDAAEGLKWAGKAVAVFLLAKEMGAYLNLDEYENYVERSGIREL